MPNRFADGRTPGSRKTTAAIPSFSSGVASRFICVDFPQPSEPSNVMKGMATILRQRAVVVERHSRMCLVFFNPVGWRKM